MAVGEPAQRAPTMIASYMLIASSLVSIPVGAGVVNLGLEGVGEIRRITYAGTYFLDAGAEVIGELGAGVEVELAEDAVDVGFDGADGEYEAFGDIAVGEAAGDELGDLGLPAGELLAARGGAAICAGFDVGFGAAGGASFKEGRAEVFGFL